MSIHFRWKGAEGRMESPAFGGLFFSHKAGGRTAEEIHVNRFELVRESGCFLETVIYLIRMTANR